MYSEGVPNFLLLSYFFFCVQFADMTMRRAFFYIREYSTDKWLFHSLSLYFSVPAGFDAASRLSRFDAFSEESGELHAATRLTPASSSPL